MPFSAALDTAGRLAIRAELQIRSANDQHFSGKRNATRELVTRAIHDLEAAIEQLSEWGG